MSLVPTGRGGQMTYASKLQRGGRAQATTWPLQAGQALDVYFDGKSGAYQPGYYRGVIDTVTRPSNNFGIIRGIILA